MLRYWIHCHLTAIPGYGAGVVLGCDCHSILLFSWAGDIENSQGNEENIMEDSGTRTNIAVYLRCFTLIRHFIALLWESISVTTVNYFLQELSTRLLISTQMIARCVRR
jgi:hypothetical protein